MCCNCLDSCEQTWQTTKRAAGTGWSQTERDTDVTDGAWGEMLGDAQSAEEFNIQIQSPPSRTSYGIQAATLSSSPGLPAEQQRSSTLVSPLYHLLCPHISEPGPLCLYAASLSDQQLNATLLLLLAALLLTHKSLPISPSLPIHPRPESVLAPYAQHTQPRLQAQPASLCGKICKRLTISSRLPELSSVLAAVRP